MPAASSVLRTHPERRMKLALIGHGRMARVVEAQARETGHEIGAVITSRNASEAPRLLPGHTAAIDFSSPGAVIEHVSAAVASGVPLVEGTTGWQGDEHEVRRIVDQGGGAMLHGANFSIGVNLFYRLVGHAAHLFRDIGGYDPFIEEAHHAGKRDAPSGTALALHALLARELGRSVPVTSTRAGHIPGIHRVGLDSAADQVLLVHTARSRARFAAGVRVLVPCGTTGEAATLTVAEHERLIALTVETARGRAKVLAGAGSNATAATIDRARAARAAGADALLLVAPYYNKPTQPGLAAHFRAVAEAVGDSPVVLYNVPGRTASNLAAATTLGLARQVENIVGVKEASGDLGQIMAILRDRPAGFRVLSGDDAVTLPLIALGADGIVSVVSNETPDLMTNLTESALR